MTDPDGMARGGAGRGDSTFAPSRRAPVITRAAAAARTRAQTPDMMAGKPSPSPSVGFVMMSTAPASIARRVIWAPLRVSEEITTVGIGRRGR